MEEVLGKSDGTTLIQHIEDCLGVFAELQETLPQLQQVVQRDNFWELLFYTIYLHDWGKTHLEFQKVLNNDSTNVWNRQRHEIFSVVFADKLNLPVDQLLLIKRAILGHHKNFDFLSRLYKSKDDLELEFECNWKRKNRKFHPEDFHANLKCSLNYSYIKFLIGEFENYFRKFLNREDNHLTRSIQFSEQQHPILEIARSTRKIRFIPNQIDYWQNLILAGSTKICDHYGSAGIKKLELLKENNFTFLNQLRNKLLSEGKDFYQHQIQASQRHGNSILIAPTGSGKTEASLGWLNTQLQLSQGRTYYILPYTASINAMHKRLLKDFAHNEDEKATNLIGIQHGKLMHYLASFYDEITDAENEKISKHEKLKQLYDQYQKIVQPLKITTPFQILKYCYGVKGFEMGFAGLAGAKLIFDEIHAYDTTTFAQILVSLKYFIQHLKCSVFIMTATLPTFMLNELKKALNVENIIKADNNLLESFTRHRVQIRDGSIFDQINEISSDYKSGKRVIVVCNTVQNAQAIYRDLLDKYSIKKSEMTLLHGRFNADDRNQKEIRVFQESNRILIGTQAIEVSLDIDYDVMYTEPAPLDALMQRFGRINRRRKKEIATVNVCKLSGEHDFRIYPEAVVKRTLNVLEKITIIHETELQELLDEVYPDWEGKEAAEYSDTVQGFEEALKNLQPYADHKEEEEAFYEKFDGIQVLPAGLFGKYKQAIEAFNFIDADKLLVNIQRGMYFKLRNNNQIDNYPFEIITPSGKAIKKPILIAKCHYSSESGMTDAFEEINELPNLL